MHAHMHTQEHFFHSTGEKEVKKKEVISSDIWFKFQEGFSNAVRKTVRIQDLM